MHQVSVTDRKTCSLTDVIEVLSFSDKEIKILLKDGIKLSISGSGLKINLFNKQNGALCAEGEVFSLKYSGGENFIKRLIK